MKTSGHHIPRSLNNKHPLSNGLSAARKGTMKNAITRLTIVLFVLGTMSAFSAQLNVKAFIDGRSDLIIQGNNVWWHHLDFAAPGKLDGADFPTYLNSFPWFPAWPQPGENRFCDCDSSIYNQLSPPLGGDGSPISIDIIAAPDFQRREARYNISVTIIQQPSPNNNFTAIIEFNDDPPPGAIWYEINISYNTPSEACIDDTQAPQVSCLVLKPSRLFPNPPRIIAQVQLQATDDCDSDPLIYVGGTKTAFVAGPFHNADIIEVAHGPSLTPGSHPGAPPNVAAIQLIGDVQIWAVDSSGNASAKQICR